MEISIEIVKNIFFDLLKRKISREEADRWAFVMIQACEAGDLLFIPPEDRDRIWKSIEYLYGIDLMEKPGEYLHTEEDIRNFIKKL